MVLLFALLHDAFRVNEGDDEAHGPRAATFAASTAVELGLTSKQVSMLCEALADHTDGTTSSKRTVGTCWDADRLTLGRVGIRIDPPISQHGRPARWQSPGGRAVVARSLPPCGRACGGGRMTKHGIGSETHTVRAAPAVGLSGGGSPTPTDSL